MIFQKVVSNLKSSIKKEFEEKKIVKTIKQEHLDILLEKKSEKKESDRNNSHKLLQTKMNKSDSYGQRGYNQKQRF